MFKSAHAVTADWKTGVDSCLAQLGQGPSSVGANLGFLYITEALSDSLDLILHDLHKRSGISHWVGSTGLGVCINNQSNCVEFFDDPTIVVLAANVPPGSFILFPSSDSERRPGRRFRSTGFCLETSKKNWPAGLPFVVAHADTSNPNALLLIEDLAESTGGFIVGGLTSSTTPKHHVSGSVTGGSVSGVIFSPEVPVVTALSQGCQPMSRPHTVSAPPIILYLSWMTDLPWTCYLVPLELTRFWRCEVSKEMFMPLFPSRDRIQPIMWCET